MAHEQPASNKKVNVPYCDGDMALVIILFTAIPLQRIYKREECGRYHWADEDRAASFGGERQ